MIGRIVKSNDTLKVQRLSGSTTGSTPLGAILAFYNDVIPTGFLLCDGSTFSVSDYPELYSLLGTNKVPDLREMTLKGAGQSGLNTITSHVVISLGGTAKSVKGEYSGMNLTGVHFIIKAIPGIEKTEVNYALDRKQSKAIEPLSIDEHTFDTVESALDALNQYCDKINSIISSELPAIEWVNALPASPNIKQKLYIIEENHKLKYYVGDSNLQTLTEMETGGSEAFVGTLAEWNALTDSERSEYTTANILDGGGTANVVTDEVTSGNMNPVTSNAVASSIQELKDGKQDKLTYTSGTMTLNSAYVTAGNIYWMKYGRVVVVDVRGVRLSSWTDGDKTLSTNSMPKPANSIIYGSVPPLNGDTAAQLFAVNINGYVMSAGGVSHPGEFYGSFTYIAQE